MGKFFELKIGQYFFEKVSKPIRTKEDIVILLIESMKIFLIGDTMPVTDIKGKIIIKVDKMSRIVFEIENKYFSFNFPFNIENIYNDEHITFYDIDTGLYLNNKNLSLILRIFNEDRMKKDSLEDLYLELADIEDLEYMEDILNVVKKLMLFESGYIRYDYDPDPTRVNKYTHPLYHFDVYYSSNNSIKLGLRNELKVEEFIDLLDIKTNCYYIYKNK